MDFEDFSGSCDMTQDSNEDNELTFEIGVTPAGETAPQASTMDVKLPNLFPKLLFEGKGKRKKGSAHAVSVSGADLSSWFLGSDVVKNESTPILCLPCRNLLSLAFAIHSPHAFRCNILS